jgi:NADH-quinone oxidoreductase subunit M
MILVWLIIIPLAGGLASWILGEKNSALTRWIPLTALVLDVVLLISFWSDPSSQAALGRGTWLIELNRPWIPQLGINIHLAMDGLSLVLVALTLFLGIISVACSWTEIREKTGFFHLNLMAILAGILGVFLSLDLFLFYFFWELMLVPMYFLISIWGHENRVYASLKFFIFTQAGGLLMLLSILGLYFMHGKATGIYTFDYTLLLGTSMTPKAAFWLMLGFFISFTVKLPMIPFHPWLPDAHTEAPTAGSVILAGLLLKTGAYGLLRFVLPFFPEAAHAVTPVVMIIAVVGIIYGAVLAFAQTDLKRLVAYTSVSHMGFVLLGIFAWNMTAMQGAIMQMLAHGVSTGALFIIVGMVQERIHTRDMDRMGGFWSTIPGLSSAAMVFALASLGLPSFGNFVAEFMVLLGVYRVNVLVTAFAAAGLVFAAIYSLWMIQRFFHGEPRAIWIIPDLSRLETGIIAVLIIAIFWLGLYPRPVLNTTGPVLSTLQNRVLPSGTTVSEPLQRVGMQGGAK